MATTQIGPGEALFQALPRSATLANRVVGQLEAMIAHGGLADGSRLPPERDLAEQFGVSRTVIREAVAALSARGLLAVQAGSGTVIQRPSVASIANLLRLSVSIGTAEGGSLVPAERQAREAARCLAVESAGLAAERRTDEDLENLSRATRELVETIAPTQPSEQTTPHPNPLLGKERGSAPTLATAFVKGSELTGADAAAFLRGVAAASHNDLLTLTLECILLLGEPCDNAYTSKQTRAILEPIRKGDIKASRRAMRDLFDEVELTRRSPSKKAAKAMRAVE